MTETFNEGDLIEATKGDTVIRGRLVPATDSHGDPLPPQADLWLVVENWPAPQTDDNPRHRTTFVVIEKAAPALPTEPGTVIAIGDWWLVKLRPYAPGIPAAWEFLPVPESVKPSLKRSGQHDQCVYGNEWVQAEVQQEGGFTIIAAPAVTS